MEGEFNHEHAKDPRKLYLLAEARFKPKQRLKTEGKSNKSNRKTRARIKNAVSRSRRLKNGLDRWTRSIYRTTHGRKQKNENV